MRTIILFLGILMFQVPAYADLQKYAIEDQDGVWVIYLDPDTGERIESELAKLGKAGTPYKFIPQNVSLPDESDRKYWTLQGNRIVVDGDKKQADLADKTQKEARKQALLKMTKAEYDEAKSLGLFR